MKLTKKQIIQMIITALLLLAPFVCHSTMSQGLHFGSQLERMDTSQVRLELRPYKIGGSPEQNEKVHYAWKISQDPEFVYMLEAENGLWTHDRWHDPSMNTVGTDWGWGINDYWHSGIVNDPRFFSDWRWNLDQTYRLYSGGTVFYGSRQTHRTVTRFEWKY